MQGTISVFEGVKSILMDAQEILDNLDDRCCRYGGWFEPMVDPLDTYFRVADMRMTVFRSEQQWVLFYERVHYNVGADEYEVSINAYGNCFQDIFDNGMDLNNQLSAYYRHPFEFDREATLVNPETDSWILNRDRFVIWFNGNRQEFTPTPQDYSAAGITFAESLEGPDTIQPEQLLRFLCWKLDHPFFNSEDHLRFLIDVFQAQPDEKERVFRQTGLSHHLSWFLQTHQWQHTDFEERPSDVPGFQILARAIATGDLTEWNSQDPATFNTDWRPWVAFRIAEQAQLREWTNDIINASSGSYEATEAADEEAKK